MSFTEALDAEGLAFFQETCAKPFSQQAVAFLNAYWDEVGDQAEFIFGCAWEVMQGVDRHATDCRFIHQYKEGCEMTLEFGLYFYEKMCKYVLENGAVCDLKTPEVKWNDKEWEKSQPQMMTAIKRKKELKEKVDADNDGNISMLEYLLYQYRDHKCNPADFVTRSMKAPDEHPEIKKARLALEEVNARIKAYEAEKYRLEQESLKPGVKGLGAKNMLAQLDSSPLKEDLNMALIKAEAAVRKATRLFGKGGSLAGDAGESAPSEGAIWWMNKDLETKKKKYGRR